MTRASRALAIASIALGALLSSAGAHAQAGPGAEPPPKPRVLFSMPPSDEQTQADLHDALLAQFALIDAEVLLVPAIAGGSLGERMAEAERRAAERQAMAVFWVEEQPDGRWFVHMMDSELERIVVRPVDAAGDKRRSAIEAVAVMARESTRALIEGVPMPEFEPAPPTAAPVIAPPPSQVAPAPRKRALRAWVGYTGGDFADEAGWRHSAVIGVGWYGSAPLFLGASVLITPPVEVTSDLAALDFKIGRVPMAAQVGYRQPLGPVVLDLELGLLLEVLYSNAPEGGQGVIVRQQKPEVLVGLCPRVRGEFTLTPWAGLFAAAGSDVILNDVEYIVRSAKAKETLLQPHRVRLVAELGMAFYF